MRVPLTLTHNTYTIYTCTITHAPLHMRVPITLTHNTYTIYTCTITHARAPNPNP